MDDAGDAIKAERDLFAAVIGTAGALILVLDPAGRIVQFNRACEELTGYDAREALGRTFWDLVVADSERVVVREEFGRLLADGRPREHDARWISKGGEPYLISWSHSVLLDDRNQTRFVISVGRDVSTRTEVERRIVDTNENERRRIGHDIHERLCNHLAGTALLTEAATTSLRGGGPVGVAELEYIAELLSEGVEHARALSRALGPVKIEQDGLQAALHELIQEVEQQSGISCSLTASDDFPDLTNSAAAIHVFRIVQEALTNVHVHARASQVEVDLSTAGNSFVVSVCDDGVGIPDAYSPNRLGIHTMRYRARLLGGTLSLERRKSGGTEVRCTAAIP